MQSQENLNNENIENKTERESRSPNAQGNIYINFGHGGAGSSNFGSNHGSNFGSNGGFGNYGGGSGSSPTFNSGSYDYFGKGFENIQFTMLQKLSKCEVKA